MTWGRRRLVGGSGCARWLRKIFNSCYHVRITTQRRARPPALRMMLVLFNQTSNQIKCVSFRFIFSILWDLWNGFAETINFYPVFPPCFNASFSRVVVVVNGIKFMLMNVSFVCVLFHGLLFWGGEELLISISLCQLGAWNESETIKLVVSKLSTPRIYFWVVFVWGFLWRKWVETVKLSDMITIY